MAYQLKITFNDGKSVDVNINEDQLNKFFDCQRNSTVFWTNENEELGFYVDNANVRYTQIYKVPDGRQEEEESCRALQTRDDRVDVQEASIAGVGESGDEELPCTA